MSATLETNGAYCEVIHTDTAKVRAFAEDSTAKAQKQPHYNYRAQVFFSFFLGGGGGGGGAEVGGRGSHLTLQGHLSSKATFKSSHN